MTKEMNRKYIPFFMGILLLLQLLLNTASDTTIVSIFIIYISIFILYVLFFGLKIKRQFILILVFIVCYILYGYSNGGWLQDSRHSLTWFITLCVFYDIFKKGKISQIITVIFVVNIFILLVYVFIKVGVPLDFFAKAQENVPSYRDYRTAGPPLYTFYFVPFLYIIYKLENDRILWMNGLIGATAILINGSGQSFAIHIFLYGITYLKFRTNYEIIINASALIMLTIAIGFYIDSAADPRLQNKLSNILSPLESSTVQTRILDLSYVLDQERSIISYALGRGIGAHSTVYRINFDYPSLSGYRTFLEIDNGFYYVFNRFGIVGLLVLLITHIRLLKKIDGIQAKISFGVLLLGINFLSIHYWTHYEGALAIGFVLAANVTKREE